MEENGESTEFLTNEMLVPLVDLGVHDLGLRGEILASPASTVLVPGCNDIQLAQVSLLGHRGRFPRSFEWENLLFTLNPGEELLWIITKKESSFTLHLGYKINRTLLSADEIAFRRKAFRTLLNQFGRRSFPETSLQELTASSTAEVLSSIESTSPDHVILVSGAPSPKSLRAEENFSPREDEDAQQFACLNDILEPFVFDDNFSIVVSIARASDTEVRDRVELFSNARSVIHPEIKKEKAVNESVQEGLQETVGGTETETISQTEKRHILRSLGQMLFGSDAYSTRQDFGRDLRKRSKDRDGHPVVRYSKGLWEDVKEHVHRQGLQMTHPIKYQRDAPIGYQRSVATNESYTSSRSTTRGSTVTIHELNASLELLDHTLEKSIELLRYGVGTGGFQSSVSIYCGDRNLGERIGKTIAGTLSGAQTYIRPFQVITYTGNHATVHLTHQGCIHQFFPGVAILSNHQAAQMLLMPEAEVPGIRLKKNVFYGRPEEIGGEVGRHEEGEKPRELEWIGDPSFYKSGIALNSRVKEGVQTIHSFRIRSQDLLSHVLVTGTTGSGKTLRTVEILNKLSPDRFQILVIETAKKVFRHKLNRETGLRVLTLGNSQDAPFRINPFYFENGTSLKRHVSVFSDALADLLPVEALIGPKLREAIQNCYKRYGWNFETGLFEGGGSIKYPTMVDLNAEVYSIANSLNYGPEINQNYRGALLGRTQLFIDELYQDIFAWDNNKSLADILGQEDVILEMDALPPSEINMPSFIVSLLLERARALRVGRASKSRPLLIIVEEAHNLMDRQREVNSSERESGKGGFLLQQLIRLLQEGRELGIGVFVIDQSPLSLSEAVVKNTNTKIVHRLTDSREAEEIGKSLGMEKEDWRDLHELEDGECIVKTKNAGKPVKLAPFDLRKAKTAKLDNQESFIPSYLRCDDIMRQIISMETWREQTVADRCGEIFEICENHKDLVSYVTRKYLLRRIADSVSEGDPFFDSLDLPEAENPQELTLLLQFFHPPSFEKIQARRMAFVDCIQRMIVGDFIKAKRLENAHGNSWWQEPKIRLAHHLNRCPAWASTPSLIEQLLTEVETCLSHQSKPSSVKRASNNIARVVTLSNRRIEAVNKACNSLLKFPNHYA